MIQYRYIYMGTLREHHHPSMFYRHVLGHDPPS